MTGPTEADVVVGDVLVGRAVEFRGHFPISPGDLFPDGSAAVWERHRSRLEPEHWDASTDTFVTTIQTWVLRSAGQVILVDTGVGNGRSRPDAPFWENFDTPFLQALAAVGVEPGDVDIVVNTHLHADHVGWNTYRDENGSWAPTFPRARYLLSRREYEYFRPGHGPGEKGNTNVFEDSIEPVMRTGQLELWDGAEQPIDAAVRLEDAAGHTPGSCVLKVSSGSSHAAFVGDLLHSPVQVFEPAVNSAFCVDQGAARSNRRRILEWTADHDALLVPAHFGGSGSVRVDRDGDSFAVRGWT